MACYSTPSVLPDMEALAQQPVRKLDSFERRGLSGLRLGQELILGDDHGRNIRMLGALRAETECLQCHSVQVGDLLGAFSYILTPEYQASEGGENRCHPPD